MTASAFNNIHFTIHKTLINPSMTNMFLIIFLTFRIVAVLNTQKKSDTIKQYFATLTFYFIFLSKRTKYLRRSLWFDLPFFSLLLFLTLRSPREDDILTLLKLEKKKMRDTFRASWSSRWIHVYVIHTVGKLEPRMIIDLARRRKKNVSSAERSSMWIDYLDVDALPKTLSYRRTSLDSMLSITPSLNCRTYEEYSIHLFFFFFYNSFSSLWI